VEAATCSSVRASVALEVALNALLLPISDFKVLTLPMAFEICFDIYFQTHSIIFQHRCDSETVFYRQFRGFSFFSPFKRLLIAICKEYEFLNVASIVGKIADQCNR